MLEVKDGKIYVEGVETIDAELIGFAFLDFADGMKKKNLDCKLQLNDEAKIIEFKGTSHIYKPLI